MGIRYSDGDASETRVLRLLESASVLGSEAAIGQEHYGDWPVRYHLSPERANLLRHLNLKGLDVLELGLGRPLARFTCDVLALGAAGHGAGT